MITILIGSIVLCLLFAPFAHAEDLPVFDKLWNYDKPDETEKAFREILPQAEASGNLAYLLQLKTQIARTLGLQREFSQAHDLLDEVEKALTTDLSGDRAGDRAGDLSVAWIRYFLERGRLLNSSGNPEASRSFFLQAWELGRRTGNDFYTVDAAHMMAIVSPSEHQMTWNKKALEIAEASEDKRARGWLGSLYNNMGWTYNDLGEYEKALVL
ncbi:MAG: hypothetical protein KJ927_19005, partial [Candidatus Eisenbacteria bacterium]|nr:hypothetical protein [Candidatus Eisenbacteria bacterium]